MDFGRDFTDVDWERYRHDSDTFIFVSLFSMAIPSRERYISFLKGIQARVFAGI